MLYFGIITTLLWFGSLGLLLCFKWAEAATLPLNALGDLLAGATAPIAFLWLILGYQLQRKELSQNTKALESQADELARQRLELSKQNEIIAESASATKELARAIENAASDLSSTMIHTR